MIELKNLTQIPEEIDIEYMEQDYEFRIGEQGYTYEVSIERDCEGNITDSQCYGILDAGKVNWDTEDNIAYAFNEDAYVWVYLDQYLFDADVGETFLYYLDVDEFLKNNWFEDEEIEFIKEHEDNGYMDVYITVTANTVIEEE